MKNRFKTSATIGLYIEETRDSGYYHVHARPVFIGMRPSDMAEIDSGRPLRESIPGARITNCGGWDADKQPNGLFLDDFQVSSQGSNDDSERKLYGFELEYRGGGSIRLNEAVMMARTLATIDKRLDALTAKYGHPASFGTYLLRVADAIGASRFVFVAKGQREGSYRDMEHRIDDLTLGAYKVDQMIHVWQHERDAVIP